MVTNRQLAEQIKEAFAQLRAPDNWRVEFPDGITVETLDALRFLLNRIGGEPSFFALGQVLLAALSDDAPDELIDQLIVYLDIIQLTSKGIPSENDERREVRALKQRHFAGLSPEQRQVIHAWLSITSAGREDRGTDITMQSALLSWS
jgi:hypothetical protein